MFSSLINFVIYTHFIETISFIINAVQKHFLLVRSAKDGRVE